MSSPTTSPPDLIRLSPSGPPIGPIGVFQVKAAEVTSTQTLAPGEGFAEIDALEVTLPGVRPGNSVVAWLHVDGTVATAGTIAVQLSESHTPAAPAFTPIPRSASTKSLADATQNDISTYGFSADFPNAPTDVTVRAEFATTASTVTVNPDAGQQAILIVAEVGPQTKVPVIS